MAIQCAVISNLEKILLGNIGWFILRFFCVLDYVTYIFTWVGKPQRSKICNVIRDCTSSPQILFFNQ